MDRLLELALVSLTDPSGLLGLAGFLAAVGVALFWIGQRSGWIKLPTRETWREEHDAQKARAERQELEIGELRQLVTELTTEVRDLKTINASLEARVKELLERPDYGALIRAVEHLEKNTVAKLDLLTETIRADAESADRRPG